MRSKKQDIRIRLLAAYFLLLISCFYFSQIKRPRWPSDRIAGEILVGVHAEAVELFAG